MTANEKTERATPRRQQKERDKGNIAKSQDMNSAVSLALGVGLLFALGSKILQGLRSLLENTLAHLNPKTIPTEDIIAIFVPYAKVTGQLLMPFLFGLMLLIAIYLRMQNGHMFSTQKLKPSFDKFSGEHLFQNLKKALNLFEVKNIVELLKSLVKVSIVASCGYSVIHSRKDELYGLIGAPVETGFAVLGSVLTQMLINVCLAMLIIGFLDKKYQDYEYDKSIKMTKQEVKDEWRNTEGDPLIKSKIKAAQMQFARQKMMSAIPSADVVVVNPTHYAVAIKYDRLNSPAPIVVAKGIDFMAFKIREVAKNNNIPIVENPPLARAIYKLVKIDAIIPAELYVAVAEILAYVYNKSKSGV